jgi:site-specific DNA recombinase
MLHSRSGGQRGDAAYVCKPLGEGHNGCGKLSVSAAAVERVVTTDLMSVWEDADRLKALLREPETTQDDRLAATIDKLETRLEELAQDRARGAISRKEHLAARDVIVADLDRARGRLARRVSRGALQEIPETREEMEAAWETWDLDRRRLVLSAFISSITVMPTTVRGRKFDESRVRIDWRV